MADVFKTVLHRGITPVGFERGHEAIRAEDEEYIGRLVGQLS